MEFITPIVRVRAILLTSNELCSDVVCRSVRVARRSISTLCRSTSNGLRRLQGLRNGRRSTSRSGPLDRVSQAKLTNVVQGLGTSTDEDSRSYFKNMRKHMIPFSTIREGDHDLIELAFSKKKSDDRKEWLRQYKVCHRFMQSISFSLTSIILPSLAPISITLKERSGTRTLSTAN